MAHRPAALLWLAAPLALVAAAVGSVGAGPSAGARARVAITIWSAPALTPQQQQQQLAQQQMLGTSFGGGTYGGSPTGALVSDLREVDVPASGEIRITGVAATLDPGSVQLRAPGDPSLAIAEQRFRQGASSPTEILARHVGDAVTVVTAKGEVTGVLRAVDEQSLALESGTGDQRRVQIMRRDGYVQDVRVPLAVDGADRPSLVWRVTSGKPGKQPVELVYRTTGLAWAADYVAVLDEAAGTVAFQAHATIKNATGTPFDDAELTLVGGPSAAHPLAPPARIVVPAHAHLGAGETVQLDLVPPRATAKTRQVVTYQAIQDTIVAMVLQQDVQMDCAQLAAAGGVTGHAELGIEVDVADQATLPEGRARLFRRSGKAGAERLEVISEDTLRSSPGVARVRISNADQITGERKQVSCTNDEVRHRLEERLEVAITNKGGRAQDVVVHELAWRMPIWKIDPASESTKGTRAGPGAQDYRLHVAASSTQKVTYTVVYAW